MTSIKHIILHKKIEVLLFELTMLSVFASITNHITAFSTPLYVSFCHSVCFAPIQFQGDCQQVFLLVYNINRNNTHKA